MHINALQHFQRTTHVLNLGLNASFSAWSLNGSRFVCCLLPEFLKFLWYVLLRKGRFCVFNCISSEGSWSPVASLLCLLLCPISWWRPPYGTCRLSLFYVALAPFCPEFPSDPDKFLPFFPQILSAWHWSFASSHVCGWHWEWFRGCSCRVLLFNSYQLLRACFQNHIFSPPLVCEPLQIKMNRIE